VSNRDGLGSRFDGAADSPCPVRRPEQDETFFHRHTDSCAHAKEEKEDHKLDDQEAFSDTGGAIERIAAA